MSDLNQYLTEEVVEKAARAEWEYEWPDRPWEKTPDDLQDFYRSAAHVNLSAVLPDIIRQAKAEALREAAQTYQQLGWHEQDSTTTTNTVIRQQAEFTMKWLCDLADFIERQGGR